MSSIEKILHDFILTSRREINTDESFSKAFLRMKTSSNKLQAVNGYQFIAKGDRL